MNCNSADGMAVSVCILRRVPIKVLERIANPSVVNSAYRFESYTLRLRIIPHFHFEIPPTTRTILLRAVRDCSVVFGS